MVIKTASWLTGLDDLKTQDSLRFLQKGLGVIHGGEAAGGD